MIGIALSLSLAASCAASPDPNQAAVMSPPDRDQFTKGGVSAFMERRCGTLDCHGQIGRPLRIYGQFGLRRTPPDQPGAPRPDGVTTDDERLDNYYAVVDLEPEAIGYAHATNGADKDFLLLKKPLDIENGGVRHKGGPVLRQIDDPGFRCLVTWIDGTVNSNDCQAATF
jgi:hypothetical protein